ncbi:MAG: GTP-binding protein [Candidatus Omnitrophica bacterium]|nr:GTP-binding protein [Candidatus Omnitrophota bacterium]
MKTPLKIAIIGHVDHGKSTLIGRLLLDTNSLPKEKISEIKKISRELGKDAELAYLADQLKEEREKNITIDTTQIFFKTHKRNYVIIDTPGHVEFIKNMMTGASLAEAAVLMVDAREGVMEQTRRHLFLINMMGIKNILVGFNKMDLVDYDEMRFKEIRDELLKFMTGLGAKPLNVIPISAKEGINISKKSRKMPWYKGTAFLAALDSLNLAGEARRKPLRFPIQDIYTVDGQDIPVGRIASGFIREGQSGVFLPALKEARVKAIKVFGKHPREASEGENIGLVLEEPLPVERGEVFTQKEDLPKITNSIKGYIFWMSETPLVINKTMTLRCATQEVSCHAERIEKRIDSSTLEILQENADTLGLNEVGLVVFKTERPVVAEKFSFAEELGRFVIEQAYNLQGAGIITDN